ncbi:glycosyl transferase family 4 [Candidatus Micrarchaeota archaeon]|nr:glycosyl transferase family 4 [Candidatus Micrarchaeota archaeon]
MSWEVILASFIFAFLAAVIAAPILIASARKKGLMGHDVNKPNRPLVAEMGGFAIFGGLAAGILVGLLAISFYDNQFQLAVFLLAALASIAFIALIGVFDDLFKLSARTKLFLPVIASLPLVAVLAGDTTMSLPFFGDVNLGLFYTFILIPLGITGAANAVNMSAGYNGLEAGIGAVASFFLLVIALSVGSLPAAVILAACLGACLAFLYFNWFPAKVFPGDIGTYTIGCALAAAVILGNMEKFGVIVLIPAFYELAATLYYSLRKVERRKVCHNPVLKDGKIIPPKGTECFTLAFFILGRKPMTERNLVLSMLALYALFGVIALAVFFLHF